MSVQHITALQVVDIIDPGKPNLERVSVYVKEYSQLADYCLVLAIRDLDGTINLIRDQMLWFGNGVVYPGDWLLIYTASGTTVVGKNTNPNSTPNPEGKVVSMHWGKPHTIFQDRRVMPGLIRIGGFDTIAIPQPSFQGGIQNLLL